MEDRQKENKGGDAKCTSNALWKRFKSGSRFLARDDLTNRNEGTQFARNDERFNQRSDAGRREVN